MKAQDVVVVLALSTLSDADGWTYAELASVAGISVSEAHAALRRLSKAGIVDWSRRVRHSALMDFLRYGLRRTFPTEIAGPALGVPTGVAAPGLSDFPDPEFAPWVWPSPAGSVRGLALQPLYASVPTAALGSTDLHTLLALVDLIRVGRARDVDLAERDLARRLTGATVVGGAISSQPALPLSSPRALRAVFEHSRVSYTIAKWAGDRRSSRLVRHPAERAVLIELKAHLADTLSAKVASGSWSPTAGYHVVADKGAGTRELTFPTMPDAIVGRRVVDELEPSIRRRDDGRVFLIRGRASSREAPGDYSWWFDEWTMWLETISRAAREQRFACVLKLDVAEFYPSVNETTARQAVARATHAHADIINLLFHCLETWRPRIRYAAGSGLPMDPHGVSSIVAHCVLTQVDEEFPDDFESKYRRFADDTVMFVQDRDTAEQRQWAHGRSLAALGLRHNAEKTRIVRADQFERNLRGDDFDAIVQAAAAGTEALHRVTAELAREISGEIESEGHGRVLRHLYTVNAGSRCPGLDRRMPDDLFAPKLRRKALEYAVSTALDKDRFEILKAAFEGQRHAASPGIQIATALMDASFVNEEVRGQFVSWAGLEVRRESTVEGSGYARGQLVYGVFKSGTRQAVEALVRWAKSAPPISDPYLRMSLFYVARAISDDPSRWGRYDEHPDARLLIRLCDRAQHGELVHLSEVLDGCLHGSRRSPSVSAPALPLLHIIMRGARGEDVLRVRKWLDGLEPGPAIAGHIARFRMELKNA